MRYFLKVMVRMESHHFFSHEIFEVALVCSQHRELTTLVSSFTSRPIWDLTRSLKAQRQLTAKWKLISATLLQCRYGRHLENLHDSHWYSAILENVDQILSHFAKSGPDGEHRLQNLERVIQRASRFAFLLFSQPGSFVFDWEAYGSSLPRGDILVFPALMQAVDDEGQIRQPPRMFSKAEVISRSMR